MLSGLLLSEVTLIIDVLEKNGMILSFLNDKCDISNLYR